MKSHIKSCFKLRCSKILLLGFILMIMMIPLVDNNSKTKSNKTPQAIIERDENIEIKSSASRLSNITIISDGYLGSYWNDGMSLWPSSAVDDSGNVHVVWEDDTDGVWGTDTEIMYCNFTVGKGWSNATVISDGYLGDYWNTGYSGDPVLAVDSSGDLHVVWSDNTPGPWGTDTEIMYCNYTSGKGWSNATVVSDGYLGSYWNDGGDWYSTIDVDSSGNIHIAWCGDSMDLLLGIDLEIFYCNYTIGKGWSNVTVISDGYLGSYWNDKESIYPSIAVDSSGNVHIVWADHTDGIWGTDMEILYCNYTTANGWSNATVISDGYLGTYWNKNASEDPSIDVDGMGNVHVAWKDDTPAVGNQDCEIMYCNHTVGKGWSNASIISDGYLGINWNDNYSIWPDLVSDDLGNIHVTWTDNTFGEWGIDIEIMYCSYTVGKGWSNATVISDGYLGSYWNNDNSYESCLAVDSSGNVHFTWMDSTDGIWGTDMEIMYARLNPEYWNLDSIHITGANWSVIESKYDWCNGAGTWSDPYVIENVSIDCRGSGSGIHIQNSNAYFRIENVIVVNSSATGAGIYLQSTSNGTIINSSLISNNLNGIWIDNSGIPGNIGNNTIQDNHITNNSVAGIFLFTSKNDTIIDNIIRDNTNYGIHLDSTSNITIYNNTFTNNGLNARDDGTLTFWDNGSLGNCWDNYAGYDTNNDNIGETPYNISGSAGSQDRFKLHGRIYRIEK